MTNLDQILQVHLKTFPAHALKSTITIYGRTQKFKKETNTKTTIFKEYVNVDRGVAVIRTQSADDIILIVA